MRPTLQVLEPSLIARTVDEAIDILARTGVLIEDEAGRDRLVTHRYGHS